MMIDTRGGRTRRMKADEEEGAVGTALARKVGADHTIMIWNISIEIATLGGAEEDVDSVTVRVDNGHLLSFGSFLSL